MAQLEEHLAQHCERGGLVVLTTHHTLQRMPAGYRALDLGQHGREAARQAPERVHE
ncbi:hypothetical protein FQZ97_472650 [compost metagenome]